MTRSKQRWLAATLVTGSLALAAVSAELLVRWFAPQKLGGSLFEVDEKLGYRNRSGLKTMHYVTRAPVEVRTNNLGFRQDDDIDVKKPKDEIRVLLLGDSFTFGWGVPQEKSFASILQKELRSSFNGFHVQFLNAGVGGYSLQNYLAYLSDVGMDLQPDVVAVFVGPNDIEENDAYGLYSLGKKNNTLERHPIPASARFSAKVWFNRLLGRSWVLHNSHLVQLIRKATIGKIQVHEAAPVTKAETKGVAAAGTDTNSSQDPLSEALIRRMARQTLSQGMRFVMVPVGEPLPKTEKFLDSHWNWFKEEGIAAFPLAKQLQSEARGPITLPEDYHYNEEGHRHFSELLLPIMKETIRGAILARAAQSATP